MDKLRDMFTEEVEEPFAEEEEPIKKEVIQVANLRGKFKQKGTNEMYANGLFVVNEKTTYTTWWKNDFKSGDILNINGIDYLVKGQPENVEMRSRYAILTLEMIEGGA